MKPLKWVGVTFHVTQTEAGWVCKTDLHDRVCGFSVLSADLAIRGYKEQYRRYLRSK